MEIAPCFLGTEEWVGGRILEVIRAIWLMDESFGRHQKEKLDVIKKQIRLILLNNYHSREVSPV